MGIWGLQTFINKFFTRWKRETVKGNMVVDGNQLCHQLYHSQFEGGVCLDWIYGGQYPDYRAIVVEFFQYLQQAGITPTVVFDGILHKNDKFDVVYDRYRGRVVRRHKVLSQMPHSPPHDNSNMSLPPLAYQVFHATLQELGVKQVIAEGDGDAMIACMANKLKCPVLSRDSDFCMTHLPRGYIPLDRFMRDYCKKSIPITAEVFHVSEFNRQFELQPDKNLHLVIPAVLGNDYLQRLPKVLTHIQRVSSKKNRFMCLLRYLKQFESFEDLLASIPKDARELALCNNYQQAVEMYNNVQKCKSNVLVAEHGIPQWLAEKYYCGKFMRYLLQARLLKYQLTASSAPSKLLRQYAYGILIRMLGTTFIREYPATDGKVKKIKVEALDCIQGSLLPKLSEVEDLSTNDRKQLLYKMLACDPVQIEALEEKWKLVIALVVFWAKATQPIKELVQALLVCFLLSSEASTKQHDLLPHRAESWLETQSAFVAWQSTYWDSTGLNQLLMEPLQSPSAALLFDGKLAMSLAAEPNIDHSVTAFGINRDLYQSLLDIVLSQYKVPSVSLKTVKRPMTTSRKWFRRAEPETHPNKAAVPQRKKVTLVAYMNSQGTYAATEETQSQKETHVSDRQRHRRRLGDWPWGPLTQRRTPLSLIYSYSAGLPPIGLDKSRKQYSRRQAKKKQSIASQMKEGIPRYMFDLLDDGWGD